MSFVLAEEHPALDETNAPGAGGRETLDFEYPSYPGHAPKSFSTNTLRPFLQSQSP